MDIPDIRAAVTGIQSAYMYSAKRVDELQQAVKSFTQLQDILVSSIIVLHGGWNVTVQSLYLLNCTTASH